MKSGMILALGLAAIVGACAAIAAWKQVQPLYSSEGLVRIAYVMPQVHGLIDQDAPLPNFDMFMQSQITLLSSRRVIDATLLDGVWKGYHITPPADGTAYFSSHMHVDVVHGSELIRVMVTDQDSVRAAAAVTAIINSYATLYNDQERSIARQRLAILDDEWAVIRAQTASQAKLRAEIIAACGSAKLQPIYDSARGRIERLEQRMQDGKAVQSLANATEKDLSAQLAMDDPTMRAYIDKRDDRRDELRRLEARFPADDAQVKAARDILADADAKVQAYAKAYAATTQLSAVEIAAARATLDELGRKIEEMEQIDKSLAQLQEKNSTLSERMNDLRSQGRLGGRLSIISTGEVPLVPAYDPRMRTASVAGGLGFLLPLALLGAIGKIRRRSDVS